MLARSLGGLNLATPIEKSQLTFLGKLTPDSGISANEVSVFWCEIGDYSITEGNEGILGVREMSEDERRAAIAKGAAGGGGSVAGSGEGCSEGGAGSTGSSGNGSVGASEGSGKASAPEEDAITDGFTLAAFTIWECSEGKGKDVR